MNPRVSIVVATYNYGRFLAEALDSIRAQTLDDWEAVIVDDGSTDDTPDIVRPYLADARFHYLLTSHVGQPAAKNVGIAACRSDLIAFLDADDSWLPEKLAKQIPLFDANPDVGVVYCRRHAIDERGHRIDVPDIKCHSGRVLPTLFLNNFVGFSSSVVRRTVFDTVGRFDEQIPLAIDYDLWLRAAIQFEFDFVDEPLVAYRTGHANLSARAEERLWVVFGIMDRFLNLRGGRALLSPVLVRQAYAETYCSLALLQRRKNSFAALRSYLHALTYNPVRQATWKGVIALTIPEWGRRIRRMLLGLPQNWSPKPSRIDSVSRSSR